MVIDFNEQKRISNIAKLQQIDPNGIYTDEDSINEGFEPMTLEETEEKLEELKNRE